jgi:glucose/arabinose dehydrogenase
MALDRKAFLLSASLLLFSAAASGDVVPNGFVETSIPGPWNEAVGLEFMPDGRLLVWERGGRVWIVENGAKVSPPLLDISEEVGAWRDYGLLGLTIHPNFAQNGYLYLYYVVDRHHLLNFGTPSYSATTNAFNDATIGRVTRYTATAASNFRSVDPTSRLVLLGATKETGIPILHQSHGTGQIIFGTDGTLLLSSGDSASYIETDSGGQVSGGYRTQALLDGILKPKEDVGSFRSQLIDCLNGKILRIDPATGAGLPSNPFFDASDPFAPRSRVWALGLRNPFRITLRPHSGSHESEDGDPGVIYIGDVGWNTWEDLHTCTAPGQNFGWPLFEGLTPHSGYWSRRTANQDAPNPLFGVNGCTRQFFDFQDLIQQDTLDANVVFPNPCDAGQTVLSSIPTFLHTRPAIDWAHGFSGPARTGIYSGNNAAVINVGANGSPVSGFPFGGNASVAGAWYTGTQFPPQYQNTYFHGDYVGQWVYCFRFDEADRPISVSQFTENVTTVAIAAGPDGALYYIGWPSSVYKVTYSPTGNQPPVAVASSDVGFGASPLTVQFQGSGSSDPNGGPLSYEWNFGDGSPVSTAADPVHTFSAGSGLPTRFDVTLTVRDSQNASSQASLIISVNNTPPVVQITSPADGALYPMTGDFTYLLTASISDLEHGPAQLSCAWQTTLHHDDHTHPEPVDAACASTATTSPVGCDGHTYFYRINLSVTDAAGLSSSDSVDLYPNCGGSSVDPNLMAAYAFGEGSGASTADFTTHQNHGTIQGASWTPDGKYGGALSFDGVNDVVLVPDSASLDLTGGMTVEAWVYPTGGLNTWRAIAQKEVDTYFLHASASDGRPAAGLTTAAGVTWQSTGAALPLNAWSHLAATYDGTTLRIYVNGVLASSRAVSGSILPSSTPLRIGGNTYAGEFFQGRIDELRIYDVALSPARIQEDMNAPIGSTPPPPPPDTEPPSVSIVAPVGGAVVSGTIDVTASAGDNVGVAGVQIFLDGNPMGAELTQAPYTLSWNTAGAANGVHGLIARARDAAGNTADSAPASVTVDNQSPPPAADLSAAYSFDEGAGSVLNDVSGNANDGAISGAVWSANGKFGGALSFDGVNDVVVINDSSTLDLGSAMTIEAWVRPAVIPSYWRSIVQKEPDSYLLHAGSGAVGPAGGITSAGGFYWAATGAALAPNVWTHLATTYDGAAVRLYVNGVQAAAAARSGSIDVTALPLRIGGNTYSGEFFNGLIDELRIFSRARTQAEIQADMNAPVGAPPAPPPAIQISSPAEGATLTASSAAILYTLSGDLDGVGGIRFTLDGAAVFQTTDLGGSFTITDLPDGPHTVLARLLDGSLVPLANPEAEDSVSFTVSLPDTEAPSISIVSPVDGATVSGLVTIVADAQDDVGVAGVQFILDSANLGPEDTEAPFQFVWNSATASVGLHSITATARDAAGNSAAAAAITVERVLVNQAPVVNAGPDLSGLVDRTVHLHGAVSDDGLPVPPGQVTALWTPVSGPAAPSWPQGDADDTHSHVVFPAPGIYVLRLTADDGELSGSDEVSIAIDPAPVNQPPAVDAGADLSAIVGQIVAVQGSASDDGLPAPPGQLALVWTGSGPASPSWPQGDQTQASAHVVFPSPGVYTLRLTASDGELSAFDEATVTVDLETVATPVITPPGGTFSPDILVSLSTATSGAAIHYTLDGVDPTEGSTLYGAPFTLTASRIVKARAFKAGANPSAIAAASFTVLPPATSLVAAYSFDEGSGAAAADSSGHGNNGSVQGAAWTTAGKYGSSLAFDGVNDVVLVPDSASLDVSSGFTIEAWVFPTSATARWQCVAQKEVDTYFLHAQSPYNAPALGYTAANGVHWQAGGGALPLNAWSHLAASYDGARIRIYVDGVERSSAASTGAVLASSTPLRIGGNTYPGEFFAGRLDEIRVFNEARSQAQIQSDMQTPIGAPQATPPGVQITSPAEGASISGGAVTVNYTLSGDAGSYHHLHLALDGGAPIEVTTLNGSHTLTGLSAGPHVLTAQLVDAAHAPLSNPEAADSVGFTVTIPDTTDPTIQITAPADGAVVSGSIPLAASAGDDTGVAGVQFLLDGVNLGAELSAAPFSQSWDSASVANGPHTFTAVARDAAGNTASDSVSFTVDNPITVPSSLVAAYGFDEASGGSVQDASGNANHGTISGAVRSAAGKFGGALAFDGVNDLVLVPDSSSLDLRTGMTLEAWIFPTVLPNGWKCILQKEVDTYFLHATSDRNRPAAGFTAGGSVTILDVGARPAANVWTHIAATYDGSTLRIYVNGVLTGSVNRTGAIDASASPLRIGGNTYAGEFFAGLIDEVRIYSTARTQAEIQSDMQTAISPP